MERGHGRPAGAFVDYDAEHFEHDPYGTTPAPLVPGAGALYALTETGVLALG